MSVKLYEARRKSVVRDAASIPTSRIGTFSFKKLLSVLEANGTMRWNYRQNVFRHFCVLDLCKPFSGPRNADDLFVVGTYVPNFKCHSFIRSRDRSGGGPQLKMWVTWPFPRPLKSQFIFVWLVLASCNDPSTYRIWCVCFHPFERQEGSPKFKFMLPCPRPLNGQYLSCVG